MRLESMTTSIVDGATKEAVTKPVPSAESRLCVATFTFPALTSVCDLFFHFHPGLHSVAASRPDSGRFCSSRAIHTRSHVPGFLIPPLRR